MTVRPVLVLVPFLAGCASAPERLAEEPAPLVEARADPRPTRKATPAGDDLAFCVEETNRYRQKKGLRPLARSGELEAFAREGARVDGRARRAHHHFATATFPAPFSGAAENELPLWSLSQFGSVREVIRQGIAQMWGEGPGGGHYENIIGAYSELGCGIYSAGDEITVVQDFRQP